MFLKRKKKGENLLKKIKGIKFSKRQEFVSITLVLTLVLIFAQNMFSIWRFIWVILLTVFTFFLSAYGLREDLKKVEWFTLLSLPVMFTIALSIFYFLLPVRWLTRIPVAILYAFGMYAILLVENIYNVAVNRSIQLLRVAHTVGLLMSLLTVFLLLNTLYSFHLHSWYNFILAFLIIFPINLQALWSKKLTEEAIGKDVFILSLFFSLIIAQGAFAISFWPLKPVLAGIFLSTSFYSLVGVGQQYLAKRLFRKNVMEYLQVFIFIFILILFTVNYRN